MNRTEPVQNHAEQILDMVREPRVSRKDALALFQKALEAARQEGVVDGMQRGYDNAIAILTKGARA